jgi:hypothetical protein
LSAIYEATNTGEDPVDLLEKLSQFEVPTVPKWIERD